MCSMLVVGWTCTIAGLFAPEIDYSALPPAGSVPEPGYRYELIFRLDDGRRMTGSQATASPSAKPEDAFELFNLSIEGTRWVTRSDKLKVTMLSYGKHAVIGVEVKSTGIAPAINYVLRQPPKKDP